MIKIFACIGTFLILSACSNVPIKTLDYKISYNNNVWGYCSDCPKRTFKHIKFYQQPVLIIRPIIKTPVLVLPKLGTDDWNEKDSVVHFAVNKSSTNDVNLNKIYQRLLSFDSTDTLYVHGYTDNSGNIKLNNKLALKRAFFVKKWLINKGITNKIIINGKGKCCYIESNATKIGKANNRRALVVLIE